LSVHATIGNGFALRAVRVIAWICIVALAALSLLPAEMMIRTGLNGRLEHVLAYAGTSFIVMFAYTPRHRIAALALLLITYAAILEIGQLLSPGRHPSIWDFGAGSLGVLVGAGTLVLVQQARIAIREP
jgi:hypothetical protein